MRRILIPALLFIGLTAALVQTQTRPKAIIGWKGSVRITESHHKEGKNREGIYVTDESKMQLSCTFDPSMSVDGTCSYSASGRTASDRGWLESSTDASSAQANVSAGYNSGKVGIGISGFSARYKLSTSVAQGDTEETNVGPFSYEAPANSPSGSWSDGNGRTITWNLTPIYEKQAPAETESEDKPEQVEAAFKAVDYDNWIPSAGENEEQPGNTLTVKARVFKKDNSSEQSPKKARFKFTLIDVSKEKGICMNWPQPKDQKGGYDLKIDPGENADFDVAKDGLSAISKELSYDASVTITSYDWGGWGTVTVTAYPEDSGTVSAHLESDKSKYDLTIPKDENNNHIADSWEDSNAAGMADADDDMLPAGDGHQGDGFSTYEEYRGFRAKGVHIRTDPFQKDLFVWDPSNLGLGYFDQSGLTIHLVSAYEWDFQGDATNPRVINFNRGNAAIGAQHLLYLKNENMPGLFGLADGTGPGTPKTCRTVKIDVARCGPTMNRH